MIVCLCNDLCSADIERAITKEGHKTYEGVLEFHGCQPMCGICEHTVSRMLTANHSDDQTVNLSSSTMASCPIL